MIHSKENSDQVQCRSRHEKGVRLCFFNATQPHLNNNMCVIQYHNMDHNNVAKQTWHGVAMKVYVIQWVLGYGQGQNNM